MKLTDALEGIGRPVAYYPGLRKMTGSTTATILLCQLFYWTGKQADADGWIYKTADELTDETGLSYDEQVTARKHLTERGLIEEQYKRLEHKMYFRVCVETINEIWEIPETGIAKMGKAETPVSTKPALPNSLIGTTENTQEKTAENGTAASASFSYSQFATNAGYGDAQRALLKASGLAALPNSEIGRLDAVAGLIIQYGYGRVLEVLTDQKEKWVNTPRKQGGGYYSVINFGWVDWALPILAGVMQTQRDSDVIVTGGKFYA